MTPQAYIDDAGIRPAPETQDASPPAGSELMRRLHQSLCRSHRALIALDLAAVEQGTREQLALCRELAAAIQKSRSAAYALDREASEELTGVEWDVWRALKVQAALLSRAQRKLIVLANMLAGTSRSYEPAAVPRAGGRV